MHDCMRTVRRGLAEVIRRLMRAGMCGAAPGRVLPSSQRMPSLSYAARTFLPYT